MLWIILYCESPFLRVEYLVIDQKTGGIGCWEKEGSLKESIDYKGISGFIYSVNILMLEISFIKSFIKCFRSGSQQSHTLAGLSEISSR